MTNGPSHEEKGAPSTRGRKRIEEKTYKSSILEPTETQDMAPSASQESSANVTRETRHQVELEWNSNFIIKNDIDAKYST